MLGEMEKYMTKSKLYIHIYTAIASLSKPYDCGLHASTTKFIDKFECRTTQIY